MQSQQFRDLARQLKDNLSRLQEKRSNWESHWQEVSDYMLPRKAEITKERARGDKRHTQIYDATAIHALELLAASLHGMLTSSANKWFSLRLKPLSQYKLPKYIANTSYFTLIVSVIKSLYYQ